MTASGEVASAREGLARVLGEHGMDGRKSYISAVCLCGWRGTRMEHRAHIADSILAAGFGDVAQAKAEALEEAARAVPVRMMTFHGGVTADINSNLRDPLLARAAEYRAAAEGGK